MIEIQIVEIVLETIYTGDSAASESRLDADVSNVGDDDERDERRSAFLDAMLS